MDMMFYPYTTLWLTTLFLQAGFTALHLAAQNGHGQVLEVMRSSQSLRISSKKLGVTALHVAAYFGQAGMYILV
jgi:ankyrin repeat protein